MFSRHPHFKKANPQIEKRVNAMIARLTLEEKIDLLGGQHNATLPNEKKGIPMFKMADGPVGVHWWCETSTAYPAVIGAAATFDQDLLYRLGRAIGRDARARGVHILLAPGVNIYRSPLCGRNFEYMGEDPVLSSKLVTQYVRGCQDQGVSVTVKHYALNFQEYDRHRVSSDVDERTLREVYLPAFRAAVVEGGAGAIMTAYNLVNGLHSSEHDFLIKTILKEEWGFDGLVMSDWDSVYDAVGAANNGLDLEMPHAKIMNRKNLLPAVKNGLVKEEVIDDKIRRLLRLAACFGWLDHEQEDKSIPLCDPTSAEVALELARTGSVLLKNQGNFLPMKKKIGKLAVIGANAHPAVICGGGSAYTQPWRVTSVLEGVKIKAPVGTVVRHSNGINPWRDWAAYQNSKFTTPKGKAGLQVEFFNNLDLSGKPVLERVDERLAYAWGNKPIAEGVNKEAFSIRWTGKIKPEKDGAHIFYCVAHDGVVQVKVGEEIVFDTLSGEYNASMTNKIKLIGGKEYDFVFTYQRTRGWNSCRFGFEHMEAIEAERREALQLARESDAVVFCGGHGPRSEGEGWDRTFGMPKDVEDFLVELAETNPNIAVVLTAGGNVDMEPWLNKVKALLHIWYPGQEGGIAAAEILFGQVNPSGKLPATFEKKLEDRGSTDNYHDENGDKRVRITDGVFTGYRHFDRNKIKPRFPFGFGLSYTKFAYENFKISKKTMKKGEALTVSFDIVNVGKMAGAESAQMYIADIEASVPRPVKELKGFAKVQLAPGERKRVSLEIDETMLQFFDMGKSAWVAEPGKFEVLIGASCEDIRFKGEFTYKG